MLRFIRVFIGERWINVKVGGSVSQSKQIDFGTPQGGVLSVTLFLLIIYSILGELGNWVNGSLFSYDLAIYITTRNQRVAARALQGVSNKLDAWAAERGLTFSPNKTASMVFKKKNKEPLEIMLRNEIIPSKESTQFLEMTLDSKQIKLWGTYKAKRALNTIKVVAGKKWGGDWTTLRKLYSAICRIKIDYGCQIYNTTSAERLKN